MRKSSSNHPAPSPRAKGLPSFSDVVKGRFNARQMALYFGMVKCIDDNIGMILEELRKLDLIDQTLIVFTSDHGDMCGELGRHNKGIPCEGSARIPIRNPRSRKSFRPGQVIEHALGTVDFKPTLLGLLDVEIDAPAEGSDASAIFQKRNPLPIPDAITYVRIPGAQKLRGSEPLPLATSWLPRLTDPLAFFDLKEGSQRTPGTISPTRPTVTKSVASPKGMKQYGKTYADPLSASATIQSDLAWAAGDSASYSPSPRSAGNQAEKK